MANPRSRILAASTLAAASIGIVFAASTASAGTVVTSAKKPFAGAGVSPSPGSRYAEPHTQISFRGLDSKDVKDIIVTGSKTGRHRGRLEAYGTGTGASFIPAVPFSPGETVTVVAPFHIAGTKGKTSTFVVGTPQPDPLQPLPLPPQAPVVQNFVSAPQLKPAVKTVVTGTAYAPGDLFISPDGLQGLNGAEIDDSQGNLVYYLPTTDQVLNAQEQSYEGQPALTFWEGTIYAAGFGRGQDLILNQHYQVVKRISAGNGLFADTHDFVLTGQGTALITAYTSELTDMTSIGGPKNGTVLDGVIQEIDLKTGLVMMEWHALDHLPISGSYQPLGAPSFDYAHVNSVQVYNSNQLMMSFRNLHQVVTISRLTGAVSLLIGGRRPNVTEPALAGTHSQHDAEPHSDGTVTVFDNGAGSGPFPHATSRGLVLKLTGRKASVVEVLAPPNGELTGAQGSMQDLADGYLVDYALAGTIVEYDKNGDVRSDLKFQPGVVTYRAYKYAWHATPTTGPSLAATTSSSGTTVNVSWNGATEIVSWRILSGADANHLAPTTTVAKTGFETSVPISTTSGVLVGQALDASGKTLGTTTPLSIG